MSERQVAPSFLARGSCLCGGVRFEVTAPFRRANHCHCSLCRKHSGRFVRPLPAPSGSGIGGLPDDGLPRYDGPPP